MHQEEVPHEKVVKAERFLLVDKKGNLRARLSDLPDGRVGLAVFDENGRIRISLAVRANGDAGLWLYKTEGKPHASFATSADSE